MDERHARRRRPGADRRRRPVEGFRASSPQSFDRIVEDAIRRLPPELLAYLENVEVAIADIPPLDQLGAHDAIPLGIYQAGSRGGAARRHGPRPDRLTLFRRPIEARAEDKRDLAGLVQEAVVHELAQHHGIDDDRLDDLGWS